MVLKDIMKMYDKDKTDELLAGKQNVGDYATNTALATGLASKQNTLTAGTGIDITGNVISATGGGGGGGGGWTAGTITDYYNNIENETYINDCLVRIEGYSDPYVAFSDCYCMGGTAEKYLNFVAVKNPSASVIATAMIVYNGESGPLQFFGFAVGDDLQTYYSWGPSVPETCVKFYFRS